MLMQKRNQKLRRYCVTVCNWAKKKERLFLTTPSNKEGRTVFGGWNLHQSTFHHLVTSTSHAEEFIQFLRQWKQSTTAGKLIIITDNASIQRSKKVRSFLQASRKLEIKYLPPYSPEYNPVEPIYLKSNVLSRYIQGEIKVMIEEWDRFIHL